MEEATVAALGPSGREKPRLSVVLAALDDYSVIREVLECLEAQTIREELEIVLVCESREALQLPPEYEKEHKHIFVLEAGAGVLLHEARAIGVRNASTPYVMILEDHCLPYGDAAERILARLEEGWDGVGPAIRNGNRSSTVGLAANCLTYGQWMGRQRSGEVDFISGHNSSYPTAHLMARRDQLEMDLIAPSRLQSILRRAGRRLFFESAAVMVHWEASSLSGVTEVLAKNGYGLGMLRASEWSPWQKTWNSLLIPPLLFYRVLRGCTAAFRVGRRPIGVVLLLPLLSGIWTLAELAGYWFGGRRSAELISDVEKNRLRFVDQSSEPIAREALSRN